MKAHICSSPWASYTKFFYSTFVNKGEAIALLTPNQKLKSGHKDKQKLLKDKHC